MSEGPFVNGITKPLFNLELNKGLDNLLFFVSTFY